MSVDSPSAGQVTPSQLMLPVTWWPAEYFAEVATWALAEGWEVWLFGSGKDVEITRQIDALTANRCFDLGGQTSLAEAIDLMAWCSAASPPKSWIT